jgi:uncharacterized protein YllA (UPF0747 family)
VVVDRPAAPSAPRLRIEELERRLRRDLSPAQLALVMQLKDAVADATGDERDEWVDRLVEGIARHFPGFGPAIRAVAQHLVESDTGASDRCGLGLKPNVAYLWDCSGPVPVDDRRA